MDPDLEAELNNRDEAAGQADNLLTDDQLITFGEMDEVRLPGKEFGA